MEDTKQEFVGKEVDQKALKTVEAIQGLYLYLAFAKPHDHSEQDRVYAILITDAQKMFAYAKMFLLG